MEETQDLPPDEKITMGTFVVKASKPISQRLKLFPGGSDGKESACDAGDLGSVPGMRRSLEKEMVTLPPVFLPGESHGQRSLVGYSPWCHKESDTTEAT